MKKISILAIYIAVLGWLSSCSFFEIDEVTNPNAADAAIVNSGATTDQIQALVTGLESRNRGYLTATKNAFGTFGREILPYFDSDPRFTTDWLGRAGQPDAGFFAVGDTYNAPFQAIKQGNFLIDAAQNTEALTSQEKSGVSGFAKTIQAYQFLVPWLAQWDNGIRTDVTDPLNPGPFVSRQEGLQYIRTLLDDAASDLNSAGSVFAFNLSDGFDGFNTPSSFLRFNRAIAARAAVYAEDWSGALTALNTSFLDLNGSMNTGPAHSYSGSNGTGANPFNPYFYPRDQFSTQIIVVHPAVLDAIEPGDNRANKFLQRSAGNEVTNQALLGYVATHQDGRWLSNQDNVPIMRNEELILLYAEANAQSGNVGEAVNAINIVRSAAGLGAFSSSNNSEVIDQILTERRFSLWHEPIGHRWVDMRRYNRLSEIEKAFIVNDEAIIPQLARPTSEVNWENR